MFSISKKLGFRLKRGLRLAVTAGFVTAVALTGPRVAAAQDALQPDYDSAAQAQQLGYDASVQSQGAQSQAAQSQAAATDPPSRVARVSVLMGNVSVEPASVDQFSAAEMNYPMTTGDRIYADAGANAEVETGQLAVRLGQQTDLTVTAMTDALAQFGLAQGSVHLRSFALDAGGTVELDTPNVAVTVLQPGDVRVDVDPGSDTTTVTAVTGQVEVDGNGLQQVLDAGQRARFAGGNPVSAQWLDAAAPDGLDQFSGDRDGVYESAAEGDAQYVNPGTIGAEDLAGNGGWETDVDYGPVWYPGGMAVDWVPYSCGRWAWIAPWGWTWVGCESWGFAPFHYGRWVHRGLRWGWVPGPPTLRPLYAPALVVFAGGSGFAVGGVHATAWFPLGPGETYVPWYHASPLYVNRVNVADIYTRNAAEARRIYSQRTDAYVATEDRQYVNRPLATVAVAQTSFAAGRPVAGSALRLSPQQMADVQVLPHPLVTPQRAIVAPAAARALPARLARPTLASREETSGQPSLVVQGVQTGAGSGVVGGRPAPVERPAVQPARVQTPTADEPSRVEAPASDDAAPVQRPLYNRAVPPEPRPSFEEQQKAIESTDPGRPLSPQQMQNLRQHQPAGPAQQRETPHPPPAPRTAPPAPRSAPPAPPKR